MYPQKKHHKNVILCIFFFSGKKPTPTVKTGIKTKDSIQNQPCTSDETLATTKPYYYNKKGQLVVDNYPFIRGMINGTDNTIYWRCSEAKKYKCYARVKTLGKKLVTIKPLSHNHPPRKEKLFTAVVWTE